MMTRHWCMTLLTTTLGAFSTACSRTGEDRYVEVTLQPYPRHCCKPMTFHTCSTETRQQESP
jgi:hypothetical protein